MHVAIAGNIGAGKTTLTRLLSKHYSWKTHYEDVDDNPYLLDFYKEMQRWSFNLQVYYLNSRFTQILDIKKNTETVIQDRTIYEDREIFAFNLYKTGNMSNRDWKTYNNLFNYMSSFVTEPDIIIYLQANTDTLMSRIKNRKREFEKDMSSEYLHSLNIYYEKWIGTLRKEKVLIVDTNNFNIFKDTERFDGIISEVKNKINV